MLVIGCRTGVGQAAAQAWDEAQAGGLQRLRQALKLWVHTARQVATRWDEGQAMKAAGGTEVTFECSHLPRAHPLLNPLSPASSSKLALNSHARRQSLLLALQRPTPACSLTVPCLPTLLCPAFPPRSLTFETPTPSHPFSLQPPALFHLHPSPPPLQTPPPLHLYPGPPFAHSHRHKLERQINPPSDFA